MTDFRSITEQQGRPVYLVPVSAVGDKFAQYDPATQQMKKLPRGMVRPTYVDLPLALTVADHLKKLIAETRSADEHKPLKDYLWKRAILIGPSLGMAAGPIAGQIVKAFGGDFGFFTQLAISIGAAIAVGAALSAGGAKLKDTLEGIKKKRDQQEEQEADRKLALEMILRQQMTRADSFGRKFPDGVFSEEGTAQ